jgi:hypothetical protein
MVTAATTGATATAQATQADMAAHAALVRDSSIQFALPRYVPPSPPSWLKPLMRFFEAIGPSLIYLFWAVVIIGGAIVLMVILHEVLGIAWRWPWPRKSAAADEEAEERRWQPEASVARILLAEADELAARGDYDAAVHLLLKRSVEDIGEKLPDFMRPSLTARDIAAAPGLPERARTAFGIIAIVVEAALFARVPVGEAGWHKARTAYEDFALRGSWSQPNPRGLRLSRREALG